MTGLESVEVRAGEEARLSCSIQSDIVLCLFEDPAGESFLMEEGKDYQSGRLSYYRENLKNECGIRIGNVQETDNGKWT